MDEYTRNLNKSSVRRNDIIEADKLFGDTERFNPETLEDMDGVIGIFAMTGAGKSVLLKDWIYTNRKKYPGGIHLICKTAKLQSGYSYIPEVNILDSYSESFLSKLWHKKVSDKKAGKELKRTLIIMDDFIGDEEYQKSKIIKDYAIGSRHLKISVIMLTQNFSSLKPIVRNNIRLAVAFSMDSEYERDKFISTYLSARNRRIGNLLFNSITRSEKYQCVVIEVYKVGVDEKQKIKKYTASIDLPTFKVPEIKEDLSDRIIMPVIVQGKFNLPKCDYSEYFSSHQ